MKLRAAGVVTHIEIDFGVLECFHCPHLLQHAVIAEFIGRS